jgi:hypothetical protein
MQKEPTRCRRNQLDAEELEFFIGVVNSTCFGHHYAHHQEYKTKPTNRMQCSSLAVLCETITNNAHGATSSPQFCYSTASAEHCMRFVAFVLYS